MKVTKHHEQDELDELDDSFLSDILEKIKPLQETVDYRMLLAAKIIKGLKAKGWNNTKFAVEIGVKNPSIISKWLSGTNNFESDTLFKIQKVLGINLINVDTTYNKTGTVFNLEVKTSNNLNDFKDLIAVQGGRQAVIVNSK